MSKQSRIDSYANPSSREHWHGESTAANISRWSERAHAESDGARHRASTRSEPVLPDLGGKVRVHDTNVRPGSGETAREIAMRDLNHDRRNTSYMPGVRRGGA
jgi:hypothetical protein